MKLGNYVVNYGKVAALKAVGVPSLALGLLHAVAYQNNIVRTEGVMPFEDRPEETQDRLKAANAWEDKVNGFLHENRMVEVDPPTLEVLEEIVVDLDYQIITAISLEDAEPIILMEEKIDNEIRERRAVIDYCLTEEE